MPHRHQYRHRYVSASRVVLNIIVRPVSWTVLLFFTAAFALPLGAPLGAAEPKPAVEKTDNKKIPPRKKDPYAWKSLFDGKTLKGWKPGKFGGEGEVRVKKGSIFLDCGESLTGIVFTGKPPRMNYEISLEGRRLDGSDFFATTTFPIGKSYCSLVVGGWGGTVVGLSNVDFYDAGDNITTRFVDLKTKQWYRVRIRVSKARIEAWIDDEQVVDLPTEGHKFGVRFEVDLCKPLGIASWCSSAELRKIRIRNLKPKEVAEAAKKRDDE
ncbi:MAG: DUF1080 domain-containing protein [Planctomycetota bacterium]|nr:DUF1080 domain-containing protein [Planctomycetota bacterium]